jgi:hypothetical protein
MLDLVREVHPGDLSRAVAPFARSPSSIEATIVQLMSMSAFTLSRVADERRRGD